MLPHRHSEAASRAPLAALEAAATAMALSTQPRAHLLEQLKLRLALLLSLPLHPTAQGLYQALLQPPACALRLGVW